MQQRVGGSSRGWAGAAMLMAALRLLAGCDGGQTGDVGSGSDECRKFYEVGRKSLSLEQADAAGYPASAAIARLVAERDSGQDVRLLAPPDLWAARGDEPPADRALPAQLFVTTAALEEVRSECEHNAGDPDFLTSLEVGVSYRIEIPQLESTLQGAGKLTLAAGEVPDIVGADVSLEGEVSGTGCALLEATAPDPVFACNSVGVWATTSCLDDTQLVPPPPIPRTDQPLAALLAAVNAASPITLSCDNGQTVTASFGLETAELYCPTGLVSNVLPASLHLDAPELGLVGGTYGTLIKTTDHADCWPRECHQAGPCGSPLPPAERASAPRCTEVVLFSQVPGTGESLSADATLQIQDDGTVLFGLSLGGSTQQCFGQVIVQE